MANEHGGEDNITAVVIRVEEDTGRRSLELSKTLPFGAKPSSGGEGEGDPVPDSDTPPAVVASTDQSPPSRP
jgi:hypothetical protein